MVKKAAAAKKDIILEKPAAMNGTEFQEMMEITEKAGVRFTIHHQRRWDKDYRLMKEVIDSQTLGDIYTIKNCAFVRSNAVDDSREIEDGLCGCAKYH
jgi:predicted dehydrogenase